MDNIDIAIDLSDEAEEAVVKDYICSIMSNASYEVFERESATSGLYEAAGKALLNEALAELIIKGMIVDQTGINDELFLNIENIKKKGLPDD